jgi:hypothetical protein
MCSARRTGSPREWTASKPSRPGRFAEAQRQMEQHVAAELAAATEAYRPLRIAGTAALALGLVLVTVATLIA